MWDGLLELIVSALKTFFCWLAQFLFSLLGALIQVVDFLFPDIAVPDFLTSIDLSSFDSYFIFLNWVVPLSYVGFLIQTVFAFYFVIFIAAPLYRAVVDLL